MTPTVMGVLNVTPDSFSDGGCWTSPAAAVRRGLEMVAQGADVIDVGGESTRPGAAEVTPDEEMRRVLPVIEALAPNVQVSVDTRNAEVARRAVDAGASIINDVSASLWQVAVDRRVGWIAVHMQGTPGTMQSAPAYGDVVREVSDYLEQRAQAATEAGVGEVWIDPGIGFGKTLKHNLALLAHLETLTRSSFPVVIGTSRKSFLGKLLGTSQPASVDDRLEGSLATAALAFAKGASMVRCHDVEETVRVARVIGAVMEAA